MSGFIALLGILGLFVCYTLSDSPERNVLLVAAVIIAINNAADRIARSKR
jgi:hypothetical protein